MGATFADDATAIDGVSGAPVTLNLTDPDSNAVVPGASPRFAGQFVLDAQGDQQLVFARRLAAGPANLTRLLLMQGSNPAGVDDVRWSTGAQGRLLVVDNSASVVYAVSGLFTAGTAFASKYRGEDRV